MLPKKIYSVREFRKNTTKPEAILWNVLRKNQLLGQKFRRQHPLSGFIIDFYCHKLKLAIEIDGAIHSLPDVKKYDEFRSKIIFDKQIGLIRIPNTLIENNLPMVIKKLETIIKNHPRLALARRGQPADRQAG